MLHWIFLIFATLVSANAPRWVMLEGAPHLTLDDWGAKTGFRSFVDQKSGRILLEKKGAPQLILLLDTPYALVGPKFLSLPDAPRWQGRKIVLSADAAERVFLPALKSEERASLRKEIVAVKGKIGSGSCLIDRPVKRIFLDPGHGGIDIGTKHGNITEKEIVLKYAQRMADELKRRGFEVSFSRTKDVYLPLEIRTKLAEEWKADLFISLHVNSSTAPQAHGTETYILSQEATDAEARKLALLENSIVQEAKEKQSAVQDILWDMEQTSYLQDSAYLASYIQEAIVGHAHDLIISKKLGSDWKNRGVRQAPFYVLNRAPMPAVLVELGYLSNARDRKLLLEKFFQESLAKALAEGVKKYRDACRSTH